MKNFVFLTLLFSLFVCSACAQTRKTPVKSTQPKPVVEAAPITEFSDAEWKVLTDALAAEDWNKSAATAAQYLEKLKVDNEKKQLAQLRYFYLYALAGKILAAAAPAQVPVDSESLWKELDAAIGSFSGKEFVLPPRNSLAECKNVLNYVCPVKDNDRAVRITATNKEGTEIHSFEYITFDEKVPFAQFADQQIFLGGRLKRAEFNQDMSKLWVMRLFFEKGFARVIVADKK